ncbi:MAG: potassium channel family protein [Tabrizicola sp.]|nr:potassium channel family protein [Tabrizicola sp.]
MKELYEGRSRGAVRFRYGLLAFDLMTILFLVVSSFVPRGSHTLAIDLAIGLVYLADILARLWISRQPLRDLFSFYGLADIAVVASLLLPLFGEGFAFLRVIRIFRLLRSEQTLLGLRRDLAFFRRNEKTIVAGVNLFLFVFLMTALVYESQKGVNENIRNYVDALYFTVATLTTTGFGDVTLKGTPGKLIAIAIMIFGISLFLRLVQVMLRPTKVDHKCPVCGLTRHDTDAVHCKACGTVLNIEDEGVD